MLKNKDIHGIEMIECCEVTGRLVEKRIEKKNYM